MSIVNEQKTLYRKEDVLTPELDEDYIPPEMEHETPWENQKLSDVALIDKITIEGSPELRAKYENCACRVAISSAVSCDRAGRPSTHAY